MEDTRVMIEMEEVEEETEEEEEKEIEIALTAANLGILHIIAENQEEMEEVEVVASILIPVRRVEDEKVLEVEVTIGDEGQGQIVETGIEREEKGDQTLEVEIEEVAEIIEVVEILEVAEMIEVVEMILEIKKGLILELEDNLNSAITEKREARRIKEEVRNKKVKNVVVPEVDPKIEGEKVIQENSKKVKVKENKDNQRLEVNTDKKLEKNKKMHLKIEKMNASHKKKDILKKEINLHEAKMIKDQRDTHMKMVLETTLQIL